MLEAWQGMWEQQHKCPVVLYGFQKEFRSWCLNVWGHEWRSNCRIYIYLLTSKSVNMTSGRLSFAMRMFSGLLSLWTVALHFGLIYCCQNTLWTIVVSGTPLVSQFCISGGVRSPRLCASSSAQDGLLRFIFEWDLHRFCLWLLFLKRYVISGFFHNYVVAFWKLKLTLQMFLKWVTNI